MHLVGDHIHFNIFSTLSLVDHAVPNVAYSSLHTFLRGQHSKFRLVSDSATHLENMRKSILDQFLNFRDEKIKNLWNHHLVLLNPLRPWQWKTCIQIWLLGWPEIFQSYEQIPIRLKIDHQNVYTLKFLRPQNWSEVRWFLGQSLFPIAMVRDDQLQPRLLFACFFTRRFRYLQWRYCTLWDRFRGWGFPYT